MQYCGINNNLETPTKNKWKQFRIPLHAKDKKGVAWEEFLTKVNAIIIQATDNDDKQLGCYFVKPRSGNMIDAVDFQSKVLFYLWQEIPKHQHELLFADNINTFEDLFSKYSAGKRVFVSAINKLLA